MGLNEKNSAGMITLSLDSLFSRLRALVDVEFDVKISYIEIYNEKVYDLLDDKNTDSIHTKGSKYAGSTKVPILTSSEAKEILAKANKNRHVRSTTMNASSSRSHAMFSIFLDMTTVNNKIGSVLHLVDLAGSEGLRNTGHQGIAQQEGIHINQGLLAVRKVIQALSAGKKLVPYRDSILTTVLQDCLNPDAFLTLIGCVSPARKDRNETLSTIRFAQSCKALENKIIPEMNAYLEQKKVSLNLY
jgi:kinesin family protein 4/21/27